MTRPTLTPYYESPCGRAVLYLGDNRDVLPAVAADACVSDPPYDLTANKAGGTGVASVNLDSPYGRCRFGTGNGSGGFMGKAWDATGVAFDPAFWLAVAGALPPGGHVLAFGGSRTYHRLACGVEDAGFEIRDQIMWLYGSGFPKSHNLKNTGAGEEWDGWGTALKPAHEPVVVARKPLAGTVAENVTEHGAGALNVDGCRIDICDGDAKGAGGGSVFEPADAVNDSSLYGNGRGAGNPRDGKGRWPANVILDAGAARVLDAQTGALSSGKMMPTHTTAGQDRTCYRPDARAGFTTMETYGDTGGASRFFYCAKASKAERGEGNRHPTVKPVDLMRYLCRLVTPPGGRVLDPFTGSGSTGVAALKEGFRFVGIEQSEEYCEIAARRLAEAVRTPSLFTGVSP
jgi:site-specific DNA-methyltransferase (adenine-specific)